MPDAAASRDWPRRVEGTRFVDVRAFDEIDSTNRRLLELARAGAPEGVVVVADHQTGGRGRLGRRWEAPAGVSLLASVLLRPPPGAGTPVGLTMRAGLALADGVREVAGFAPELKWPNDLLVEERKLAGMLTEVDPGAPGAPAGVVVGVGVNVNWASPPDELAGAAVSCREVAGRPVDRARLLVAFLRRLEERLAAGGAPVPGDYRARLATLGRRVRVELPEGAVTGVAVDVDHAGALLVETAPGCVVEVAAGDVVHLRSAGGGPPGR